MTSYRDLPRRIAEFGKVNRYEPSGALHGLMRVREFTQDDAYLLYASRWKKVPDVIELIMDIYKDFGFEDVRIKFSDRPENRIGSDEVLGQLEAALKGALEGMGLRTMAIILVKNFLRTKARICPTRCYWPRLAMRNLAGGYEPTRTPRRAYIDEESERKRPVLLHRALFGSAGRFTGILIENYAGRLPMWLLGANSVSNYNKRS